MSSCGEERCSDDWACPARSRSVGSDSSYAYTDLDSAFSDQSKLSSGPVPLNYAGGTAPFTVDADGRRLILVRTGAGAGSAGGPRRTGSTSSTSSASASSILDDLWPVCKVNYTCITSDGVRLHLVRGTCAQAAALRPRAYPVLMVPGLASSSKATWDITPSLSLLDHVARQGYDVWSVDLRGNGDSEAPSVGFMGEGWCVDDHLFKDLPALVELIIKETGAQQLHWIGHSMGGMLATGALSLQGYLARHIHSIVMLGSGCYGAGSWHSVLKPLVTVLCYFGFPGRLAGSLVGRLLGTWVGLSLIESAFYWRSNMDLSVGKKMMSSCFRFVPHGLVSQFMHSMNSPHGLTTTDGKMKYCDPKALQHVTTPVLGITGDWDLFCPPPGGLRTVQQFGGEQRRFVFLGPAYGTSKNHYGHFDIIMGKDARQEVWPYITAFLAEQDMLCNGEPAVTPSTVSKISSLSPADELDAAVRLVDAELAVGATVAQAEKPQKSQPLMERSGWAQDVA